MPQYKFNRWFLILLISLTATSSWAHKLNVFAYPEGNEVHVEAYYSRGQPCRDCTAEVRDSAGRVLLSGVTDDEGVWSFVPPATSELEVFINAGDGHGASYTLAESDYPVGDSPTEGEVEARREEVLREAEEWEAEEGHTHSHDHEHGHSHDGEEASEPDGDTLVGALTVAELEKIVDSALEKRIAPMRRSLALSEVDHLSLESIIGGVGYILGLFGIAAFFLSKKARTH
jgi:nickel transport protein